MVDAGEGKLSRPQDDGSCSGGGSGGTNTGPSGLKDGGGEVDYSLFFYPQ
jgi:hypothetical protein